jgi:AcrR family transcriptional regulator
MKASGRDRILDAATRLFYRDGINRVGIDTVIAEAGVAKMTLYNHFSSKDELVLAFLEKVNREWSTWLRQRVDAAEGPARARPLVVFDALGEWFLTPEFRGCPFISTAAEFRDPRHPAHRAAWAFKRGLRDYFAELLVVGDYARADELADQMLLLADGAIVRAAMEGGNDSARVARGAAEVMLSAG